MKSPFSSPSFILFVLAMAASVSSLKALYLGEPELTNSTTDKSETTTSVTTTTTTTTTTQPSTTSESTNSTLSDTPEDSLAIDFTSYQDTSTFSCTGRVTGYYADVKLDCRVYHFCTQMEGIDGPTYQRMSYLCLEDSYFDQKDLNCVKKVDMKVSCDNAEKEYEKSNKQFDPKEDSQPSMSDNLAANIMMNPIARFIAGR